MSTPPLNNPGGKSCVPWHKEQIYSHRQKKSTEYTEEDLARDMNALTMEERQAVMYDIHGVPDLAMETSDFIRTKVDETKEVLRNFPSTTCALAAWEKAVYLRPDLGSDEHFLLFLRCKKFDAFDAANWMLKYYDTKREVWGEDFLTHRITWDDLTDEDRAAIRTGPTRLLPRNQESPNSRDILYYRNFTWDVTRNPSALIRAMMYDFYPRVIDDELSLRKGFVVISDYRGKWKSTPLQYLQFLGQFCPLIEATPLHASAVHILLDDDTSQHIVRSAIAVIRRAARIRIRIHAGSWTEIRYSLRTFGIDIPDDSIGSEGVFSQEAIDRDIEINRRLEVERRLKEAKYRHPASHIALHPNKQDILLGRNKKVLLGWPGNVAYYKLIQQRAPAYLQEDGRLDKTTMTVNTMNILRDEFKARFLVRRDTHWEVACDSEVQRKVAQALRNEARKLLSQMKDTIRCQAL